MALKYDVSKLSLNVIGSKSARYNFVHRNNRNLGYVYPEVLNGLTFIVVKLSTFYEFQYRQTQTRNSLDTANFIANSTFGWAMQILFHGTLPFTKKQNISFFLTLEHCSGVW